MKNYAHALLALTLVALVAKEPASAQTPENDQGSVFWSASAGFSQMKDQLNVGLVYSGPQLGARYGQRHQDGLDQWEWGVDVDLGFLFARGMTAIDLHLQPFDGAYLFRIVDADWQLYLGPGVTGSYHTYVNPELQSGSFFWYTQYNLEVRLAADAEVFGQRFRATLASALVSAASRPPAMPDPYFYNWNLWDMVQRAHSNMTIESLDKIQHTAISLEWWLPGTPDLSLTYGMNYNSYQQDPTLETLQHTLRITWY